VFTSTIGTPLDPEAFGRTVPRICERTGLGHWSIHELRHSCASLLLAMGVPLEVVSDTLGHASIRVTMDVYGHLLALSRMHAAEAMRRALSLDELPDFDPLATELATNLAGDDTDNKLNWDSVGRPGLDPGTLGLKAPATVSRAVAPCRRTSCYCRSKAARRRHQETCCSVLKRAATELLG
jgi:hypothetical protein